MIKTALIFTGQGAQIVGMGRDLAEQFSTAKALFNRANDILGFNIAKLCFEGPEALLTETQNAQPAIYLVSWICWEVLREKVPDLQFHSAAGLSLGEFTALTAADSLSFEEGLHVVRQRGMFMDDACRATRGSMAAIIGLDEQKTRRVCDQSGLTIANLNCPGQIVISGEADRIPGAVELARKEGAKRAIPLAVAGAYHSPLMKSAQPRLQAALAEVKLRSPVIPVISNVTAQPHGAPETIAETLIKQVVSPVLWEESMRYLLAKGFSRFIEFGPGSVLKGFLKRIDDSVQCINVSGVASLEAAVHDLGAY